MELIKDHIYRHADGSLFLACVTRDKKSLSLFLIIDEDDEPIDGTGNFLCFLRLAESPTGWVMTRPQGGKPIRGADNETVAKNVEFVVTNFDLEQLEHIGLSRRVAALDADFRAIMGDTY